MKIWTAHEKPHAAPLLVREGFSFGAFFFGPFWLAAQRAWLPAGVTLLLEVLIPALTGAPASIVLSLGLAFLVGLSGRDMIRWSLAQTGYTLTAAIAGRSEEEAQARLFEARPDLVERTMVVEAA